VLIVKCGSANRHSAPKKQKIAITGTRNMTLKWTQQLALTFAIAISGTGLSGSPGLAFSSEAQQMCTGDAMRLCGSEIPYISRIAACMHKNRAHVSPGCRAVMEREAITARKNTRAAVD
jgi:hypothetical protein